VEKTRVPSNACYIKAAFTTTNRAEIVPSNRWTVRNSSEIFRLYVSAADADIHLNKQTIARCHMRYLLTCGFRLPDFSFARSFHFHGAG